MTHLLEWLTMSFAALVQRSLLGALLVGLLLLITVACRHVVSPRVRFMLWLLVPLQLLWCVPLPSSLSLLNYLPGGNDAVSQNPVTSETPENTVRRQSQQETPPPDDGWGDAGIAQAETAFVAGPFDGDEALELIDSPAEKPAREPMIAASETAVAEISPPPMRAWLSYAAVIWVCGTLLFYGVYFVQVLRFQRWIRKAETVTNQKTLRQFERCKKIMGINAWVMVVESPRVRGPFLVGVFRPVIVLPRGLTASLGEDAMAHLFSHELAHLKRSDLIVGWLMAFVLGLYWFNPFAWLTVRVMNPLREEAADAMVLESLDPERKLDYGSTLLTMSRRFANPAFVPGIAGILETRSFLHRRIEMITRPGTWRTRWSVLAAAACLALLTTLVTDAKPQENDTRPATEYNTGKPIYETGQGGGTSQPLPNAEPREYTVTKPWYERKRTYTAIVSPEETEKPAAKPKQEIDPRRMPKIIAMYPPNNAKNVDPNITQVYVTFDIPMDGGRAWAQRSDQTALDHDEESEIFWTSDMRTCVAPVKLKPNKTYEVLMNVKPFIGFRSEGGVASRQMFYSFKTGRGPVSENARAEHAAKDLTEESPSPKVEGFDADGNDEDADEYVDAELEKKGRQALKLMAERGKYWIFTQCYEAESWSYHFKNSIIEENGETKPDSEQKYDIEVVRKEGSSTWEKFRGITYYSVLQALATLAVDEDTANDVRFKAVTVDEKEIKLHFVVKDHDLGCRIGNGMNGSWYGFYQMTQNEGELTLDRKTLMPKMLVFDEKRGERYGKFLAVGKGQYVPQRIQIKNGDMLFDMNFNVYEPGLWLLESSDYSVKNKDGSEFRSKSEVSDVKVNGEPGRLIEK